MGEQESVKMGKISWRWIFILVPTIVVGLTAFTIIGCGSSDTPSQVVEKFYKYTQENDCQKVADLVIDTYPELAERYVNDCKKYADRLVSYSVTGETIYETTTTGDVLEVRTSVGGNIANVDVEVTIKENGVEKTNSGKRFLVKRGDEWKLTETENRSSKPPN